MAQNKKHYRDFAAQLRREIIKQGERSLPSVDIGTVVKIKPAVIIQPSTRDVDYEEDDLVWAIDRGRLAINDIVLLTRDSDNQPIVAASLNGEDPDPTLHLKGKALQTQLNRISVDARYWRAPVFTLTALNSLTTDPEGTIRLVLASDTLYRFTANPPAWSVVSGGGGGTLDALTDVTITAVASNQLLKYNSGTSQWENFTHDFITATLAAATYAPIASPTFTGVPAAPTAAVDTNTTQIATTAFVLAQATAATPLMDGVAAVGSSTRYARGDHVHPTDTSRAALASPTFTGIPAAPTAAVDTNTTQIATTAFVLAQAASATPLMDGVATVGSSTRFARGDHVHPVDTSRAALASPTFTGVPAGPTAAVDTNTTQLATTAFVLAQAASATPLMDGVAAVGTSTRFARGDHVHPTDTSRAPLASPTFTGVPAGPTAAVDTNTTQFATTAFVLAQAASATPLIDGAADVGVSTRFARGDHVHPTDTSRAALASPTFTGTPAAPTSAVDTNTTQIATTAFVLAQAASATPLIDGVAAVGTSTRFARGDHVHPTDTSRAALASPTFTGTPSLPTGTIAVTQAAGDSSTAVATTAFVTSADFATNRVMEIADSFKADIAHRHDDLYLSGKRVLNGYATYSADVTTVTPGTFYDICSITIDGRNSFAPMILIAQPAYDFLNSAGSAYVDLRIYNTTDTAVSGPGGWCRTYMSIASTGYFCGPLRAVVEPFSGSKTFKFQLASGSGTATAQTSGLVGYLEAVWGQREA